MAVIATSSVVSVYRRGAEPAFGEDAEADLAANLGPLVGLLGEHGADKADQ
jgi:hypothetical protein